MHQIHDHVDIDVHLERLRNHKIRFTIEKLGYKHVYCPGITRIEERFIFAGDHGVSDDEVLLHPGDDV